MLNKIEKYLATINYVLLLAILLAGYSLLCIAAYYSHPNAESFDLAADARNEGIFNSTLRLLVTFDGRYFTNVLHGLNPLAVGLLDYNKWMPVFSMLFFTASFYFFISAIFRRTEWYNLLLFSLLILLVSLGLSSSLVHELYWLVSSFVYFYSWIFWFLWVGCFLRYIVRGKHHFLYYFFSNLFLFLAVGINEMFLVLNVVSVGYLVYIDSYKNKVSITHHLPIVITLLSSVLLFVSSSGIVDRLYFAPVDENISYWIVLKNSIVHFSSEFWRLLANNYIIIPILFLLSTDFLNIKTDSFWTLNRKQQVVFFVLCVVTIYLMTWAFYLPLGRLDHYFPERIYTSIGTGIIMCLILFLPFFLRNVFLTTNKNFHFVMLLITAGGMFLGNTNIRLINEEYKMGVFHKYNDEMNKRYAIINAVKKCNNCRQIAVIDTLSAKPKSIYYGPDIEPNRNPYYWNQAYEVFFDIDEVRLKGDSVYK